MKKIYFVAIGLISLGIFLLLNASKDMSTYASFDDAIQSQEEVKLVGTLAKDKEMIYDPEIDPNYFSFYVNDKAGKQRKVVLLSEKPQDFELSEQIVLTGKMKGEDFVARDILLKCPSKYKDEELFLKENESI